MTKLSFTQRIMQNTKPTTDRRASAGPNGITISPPAYGIDIIDNGFLGNRFEGETEKSLPKSTSETTDGRTIQMKIGKRTDNSNSGKVTSGSGAGLPPSLKTGIETLSGMPMDDVTVHRNSPKPAQLQALAYTQGTNIHVGPGQERHLPHEAWHVVQQKQGRVKPTLQRKGITINDDAKLEREAETMGKRATYYKSDANVLAKPVTRESSQNSLAHRNSTNSADGNIIQRVPSKIHTTEAYARFWIQPTQSAKWTKQPEVKNGQFDDDFYLDQPKIEANAIIDWEQRQVNPMQQINRWDIAFSQTLTRDTLRINYADGGYDYKATATPILDSASQNCVPFYDPYPHDSHKRMAHVVPPPQKIKMIDKPAETIEASQRSRILRKTTLSTVRKDAYFTTYVIAYNKTRDEVVLLSAFDWSYDLIITDAGNPGKRKIANKTMKISPVRYYPYDENPRFAPPIANQNVYGGEYRQEDPIEFQPPQLPQLQQPVNGNDVDENPAPEGY